MKYNSIESSLRKPRNEWRKIWEGEALPKCKNLMKEFPIQLDPLLIMMYPHYLFIMNKIHIFNLKRKE